MERNVYEQRNTNSYRREAETRRITPSRSGVAAREGISGVFRGSLKARGLRLVVRSAGGPTFCFDIQAGPSEFKSLYRAAPMPIAIKGSMIFDLP